MKAEAGHLTITARQKTISARVKIANRSQSEDIRLAKFVQRCCINVGQLYVVARELEQGVAGVFGVIQRSTGKDRGQGLEKFHGWRLPNSFGGELVEQPSATGQIKGCNSFT